jgi:uncharacterized protein (UPF0147 family)
MVDVNLNNVINLLNEIGEEPSTPKNVKEKMTRVADLLKQDVDFSIKIHKALNELDEIISDNNMQHYTRTQIWNVVSLLEKV